MAKILFIDDDRSLTESILDGLRSAGFEVVFEQDAVRALDIIRSHTPFDLIILDVMMRKKSLEAMSGESQTGYILYRHIRDARSSIPIIILSVRPFEDAPPNIQQDKDIVWIPKPAEYTDIVQSVKEMLGKCSKD